MWKISRTNLANIRWSHIFFALSLDTLRIILAVFTVFLFLKSVLSGANVTSLGLFKLGLLLLANFFVTEKMRTYFKIGYKNEIPKNTRLFWLAGALFAFLILALDLWGTGWKKAIFFSFFGVTLIFLIKKLFSEKAH